MPTNFIDSVSPHREATVVFITGNHPKIAYPQFAKSPVQVFVTVSNFGSQGRSDIPHGERPTNWKVVRQPGTDFQFCAIALLLAGMLI